MHAACVALSTRMRGAVNLHAWRCQPVAAHLTTASSMHADCSGTTAAPAGSAARDGPSSCCPTCGALLARVDLPRAPLAGARQQAAQQHVQLQDYLPRRPSTAPARHSALVRQDLQVNRLSKPIVHQRVIGSSIKAAR
jgi:hypothetical protein